MIGEIIEATGAVMIYSGGVGVTAGYLRKDDIGIISAFAWPVVLPLRLMLNAVSKDERIHKQNVVEARRKSELARLEVERVSIQAKEVEETNRMLAELAKTPEEKKAEILADTDAVRKKTNAVREVQPDYPNFRGIETSDICLGCEGKGRVYYHPDYAKHRLCGGTGITSNRQYKYRPIDSSADPWKTRYILKTVVSPKASRTSPQNYPNGSVPMRYDTIYNGYGTEIYRVEYDDGSINYAFENPFFRK